MYAEGKMRCSVVAETGARSYKRPLAIIWSCKVLGCVFGWYWCVKDAVLMLQFPSINFKHDKGGFKQGLNKDKGGL